MADVAVRESWLVDRKESSWAMVRPPRVNERSDLNVAGRVEEARARRDGLKQERQKVQDQLQQVRGDRRRQADLNRRKGVLLMPVRDAEHAVKQWEGFEREFERACRNVAALTTCPACRSADVDFKAREKDCFAARCRSESCAARWELRYDPDTESRIPVFLPGNARPDTWPTDAAPRWVDDALGCDVLAVPAARDGADIEFLPPRTERHEVF